MSDVEVLNLSSSLPVYVVDGQSVKRLLDGMIVGTLKVSIEEEVDAAEKKALEESIIQENEGDLSWLDDNKTTGEIGEILALEYLKTLYSKVYDVSENAKKGYDIEVRENGCVRGFEVKTSRTKIGFHITFNELKVATEKQDDYYLFFIHEDVADEEYEGYIIQNPIKLFNINFTELTNQIKCQSATVIPNRFFIKFDKGFLRSLEKRRLNQ